MPRTGARKTLGPAGASQGTGFTKESAAAGASVDILDTELGTNFGVIADELTVNEFVDDYKVVRVPTATAEAADTIGVALIERNAADSGFTVFFTAAAAAATHVSVRVTAI